MGNYQNNLSLQYMKKRVYILFAHSEQESDFEVIASSASYSEISDCINEYELESEDEDIDLTEEADYCDFGFQGDDMRYVLDSRIVEIPQDAVLFALFVNGDDICWEGEMSGIFASKEDAWNALCSNANLDEEDVPEKHDLFMEYGSVSDDDSMNWECLEIQL